jgi:ABC-type multidrug transport system fused ATPase/permease subunit
MEKIKKLFYIIPNSQRNNLIMLVLLVLLVTILELASITFVYPLIDAIINNKEMLLLKKYLGVFQLYFFSIDYKLFTILIFLGVVIIKNLFLYIFINKQFNFIYNCEKIISENLIRKYTNLNYNFFLKTPSSLLIRNLTHEVHLFNDVLLNYIILISEILVAACLLTVLFLLNPSITTFLILNFLLIAVLFNQFFKKKTKKLSESLQKFEGVRLEKLAEGFENIKEILIYRLNNFFIKSYGEVHKKTLESRKYSSKLRQYPRLVVEIFAILIVCIALIILFSSSLNVNEILPILSLFTLALLRTIPTQNKLIYSFQVIKFGGKTINLLFDNLNILEDKTLDIIKKKKIHKFCQI